MTKKEMKNALRKKIKKIISKYDSKSYPFDFYDLLKGKNIAIYYPIDKELVIDLKKFDKDINLYLPFSYKDGKMVFRKMANYVTDELGIMSSDGEEIDAKMLDTILIPAYAYNKKGYRLGHGHAYYDRVLAHVNALKIGFCLDECVIEDSFEESHDLKVDYIVSEKNIYKIGK